MIAEGLLGLLQKGHCLARMHWKRPLHVQREAEIFSKLAPWATGAESARESFTVRRASLLPDSGMYNTLRHHMMLVLGAGLLSTPIFLLNLVHCVHLQHRLLCKTVPLQKCNQA